MGAHRARNSYCQICICCRWRSSAWTYCWWSSRAKLPQVEMDGILDRHLHVINALSGCAHPRRKLCIATSGLQSTETTIRDRQLGFARKVRRVGCISESDGNQVRSQAISDADDADLFLRCVICFVRLRILYANLATFPIEFQEERGWNLLVGALPFLALLIGILIGGAANVLNQSYYNRQQGYSRSQTSANYGWLDCLSWRPLPLRLDL